MMAKSRETTLSIWCDVCLARFDGPAMSLEGVQRQAADKWQWVVTPAGVNLCGACVARGELKRPEYKSTVEKHKSKQNK